ncbi:ABC transporter substrate-binding protein [Streptacidiphilus sp. P02-A3a]|uniref:peptide ABC transporter substrate-binding protein n=1 Tax=Streptacidiphilus sp. P02-A3a TaxID=2704468 RepID=UPI0015FDEB4E|nr:ABC transporter substrate-binding protein [Streptacidiphilus sp. P02-A3a]QMU71450.1 ABC transporter substrate-binding protein [Streptacidiphilus sp. P02-A3a]
MTSGVLRVQLGEPSAIDPATAFEHDGTLVAGLLADPLVDCDPVTGRLAPAAASGWTVAADGLSVRFELRPGVRFHHGREVTAEDYRYALSRAVRPGTRSATASALAVLDGYQEVASGREQLLRGVGALGPYRLEVRLSRPFHEIAAVFSQRVTAPVPAELVEADPVGFARRPVSNGPYRVVEEWRPGRGPVLERFDGYHAANAAHPRGGAGLSPRIAFHLHTDLSDAYRAFLDGELDVTEVPPDLVDRAAVEAGAALHRTPNPMVTYLGFPTRVPPFDDPVVRRAVAMCVDRESIGRRRFGGARPVADRLVPPLSDPGPGPSRPRLRLAHDPRGARRLLAEQGIEPPPGGVTLLFNAGQGHDGWVADVARGISEGLGWQVSPRRLEWPAYLRELRYSEGLFRMNWAVGQLSFDHALYPLVHSTAVAEGNHPGYRSPRVDALLDTARATADASVRRGRYREAEQAALDELPLLPLWQGALHHLVAPDRVQPLGPPIDVLGVPALRQYRLLGTATGSRDRNRVAAGIGDPR